MDYPSFNNARVYSVPDTRFMRHGFALQRPAAVIQPGCPITPVNMLPYNVATTGVPYGYTLVPQPMYAPLPPQQRMLPVPGGRNMYSVVDLDDEEDVVVPPPRPRSRIIDDTESPEMEEFSAATRAIRKDANAILQRLSSSRPTSRATDLFKSYDYDTKPLTPRYIAPPPDRSHLRPTSPGLDEEPDPVLQSLRPGRRGYGSGSGLSSRPVLYSSTLLGSGSDRVYTPTSITANRINSLYKDLDDPLYAPELKSFDYTECLRRDREEAKEKVRGDVSQRAALLEPAIGLRSSIKRERSGYDPTSVKSNISIRAQYAAMRAAAGRSAALRPNSALSSIGGSIYSAEAGPPSTAANPPKVNANANATESVPST